MVRHEAWPGRAPARRPGRVCVGRSPFTLVAVLLLATPGCDDGTAPRSEPQSAARRPLATPPPELLGLEPAVLPDPAEPGISDLARLARYVFREMQRHEQACNLGNPFHDTLSFTIETEVKGGRIVSIRLGSAGLERGGETLPVPGGKPPAELVAYVECLRPVLEALRMAPAPADGVYRPEYSHPGHAGS